MSRLKYCPELAKDISPDRRIALNARFRRRRRYINVLFLAAAVTTLCAPTMFNVDTDNTSFFGLSGQSVEHILTDDQAAEIKRKVTVPLLAGYIGKTNSVMASVFTVADVSYTGSWAWVDDGNGSYRVRFLTSGTFTPAKTIVIDVFMVGGGGGGRNGVSNQNGGGGGAGGYAGTWQSITLNANQSYTVTIGAGGTANGGTGGTTSISGSGIATLSKAGGAPGAAFYYGGIGGSGGGGPGGTGGSDGSNGSGSNYGSGQGSTTREFGEAGATLYAGAGGGGVLGTGGAGGAGGGGAGGGAPYSGTAYAGTAGTNNLGGGGGGGGSSTTNGAAGAAGGSGIMIIRNHR